MKTNCTKFIRHHFHLLIQFSLFCIYPLKASRGLIVRLKYNTLWFYHTFQHFIPLVHNTILSGYIAYHMKEFVPFFIDQGIMMWTVMHHSTCIAKQKTSTKVVEQILNQKYTYINRCSFRYIYIFNDLIIKIYIRIIIFKYS